MSDTVSVMQGVTFEGAVRVRDIGPSGMVTLRGDLADPALARAVKAAVGLALPGPRKIRFGKSGGVAWMSPDELLLFCEHAAADGMVTKLEQALAGVHHLCVNVSDARARFRLEGPGVREVLAKGSPTDLRPRSFPVGEIRRSRLGQVAAAFWLTDEETADILCFRSVGEFTWHWLLNAARPETLPGVL